MSALSTTIKEIRNISINDKRRHNADVENKDGIVFIMGAFEDFFIRFAEEKLNATSPKFTDESNQFSKSIVLFVWDLLLKEVRFSTRCYNLKSFGS